MSNSSRGRRSRRRRKYIARMSLLIAIALILVAAIVFIGIKIIGAISGPDNDDPEKDPIVSTTTEPGGDDDDNDGTTTTTTKKTTTTTAGAKALLEEAQRLAASYDYDAAIELIKTYPKYESSNALRTALDTFTEEKSKLVLWEDNTKISHVFFHTLIADTALAFDGDEDEPGYNQVMTTIDEFNKIMQQMYDNGYVLVSLHQIAEIEKQADGTEKMVWKDIYLPEGKKPFVLSQDDVCYYEYMDGDGFATRLIIDENGKVTNEMKLSDGTVVTGSFDCLPLLEDFIAEHPDFSYRGARGILALTGYNGVFGYRTSYRAYGPDSDKPNPNIEEDRQTAAEVAEAIKALGWEIASHSWGHRDYGKISWDSFVFDVDIWENEVETVVGETDILIYPFGADVGDWHKYADDNERYKYLDKVGFDYFCNVDGSVSYWVQKSGGYLRQGRMNLDGYRMYQDLYKGKTKLVDFFDVASVFDPTRPLPVPDM